MPTKQELRSIKKLEQEIAADFGGRRVPLSGAGMEKGDGRVLSRFSVSKGCVELLEAGYRIEVKTTKATFYRITWLTWHKIAKAACSAGETPFLCVDFNGATSSRYTILPTLAYGYFWSSPGKTLTFRDPERTEATSFTLRAKEVEPNGYLRVSFKGRDLARTNYDVCVVDYYAAKEKIRACVT